MHVCRLDLFNALTLGGKELELFEEETGAVSCRLLYFIVPFLPCTFSFGVDCVQR